ncbi:TonB-dependent receptor [Sphingomonas elodea]|uniref:TonB-dependent receptor n=2 Tax=Pseudomonadota TaxID=1224 RepID=UPI0002630A8C|nr:TonB-dependent receptor [Sphingomonas elodea]
MNRAHHSRRHIAATASLAALAVMLGGGIGSAAAQTSQARESVPAPNMSSQLTEAQEEAIVVVGSRASQQSANDRKKNARTATDSIVADDIGSFPDRNVNEAISRVPGVALSRNEFGEGDGIALRGNGPDLTRVELDGIGVQSTNGLAIAGAGGRGADLRELPAEIVKSVDVVKGSTADMTEGGLGGTVQIKTRTGLDFKKPYFSLRAGAGQNSLGKDWTPDVNGVFANKFFDDRLGVILTGTYSKLQNNGHMYETTTSGNRGYARLFDFDQSPDKTFEYNVNTIGTDAADVVFANSLETPRSLITKSASAKTKADCFTLFPHNGTAAAAARAQRILEQQTCLNQWNDYTPSLIRNFTSTQTDERYSFDGRLDFRITDRLTVFGKATLANRKVHDQFRSRNPVTLFNQNVTGTFLDSATGYPRARTLNPNAGAGYYLFDGLNNVANNATIGNVLNVVPSSIVVDSKHNVTAMTLTNNSVNIDQIENRINTKTSYYQTGFEWQGDRVLLEGMAGMTKATTSRGDMRTSRSYMYGDAQLKLQSNGLWDIQLPANYDETNPANFVQLTAPRCIGAGTAPTCLGQNAVLATEFNPATPAYTVGQLPLTTPTFAVQYTPALGEATEKIARLDLTYDTDGILPFIKRVKVGGMYRNNEIQRWNNGGYTVSSPIGTFGQPGFVPGVYVPTAIVRGSLRACQPTATSTVSCNYGYVPSTDPRSARSGTDTLTPQQLQDLFARTLEAPDSSYFGDLPNRGNLPPSWQGIRTDKLFEALGASQFMNFDCLQTCVGSDGKTYDQPVTRADETIQNVYGMFDFEQNLPRGIRVTGNVGLRGVFVRVKGTGLQTLNSIRVTPAFDAANPNAPGGFITQTFSQLVTLDRTTRDWLPTFNLNLWGFDDSLVFRVYGGKTVARPNMNNLVPGGTCTIDERLTLTEGEDVNNCTAGRVGNPALKPFTAWSYNASLEWYPNRDTLISATYGKLDVKVGNPIQVTRIERPFAGSTETDPGTGLPLADVQFNVPTWDNGPGYKRDIWEFQAKTAFTFLPWFLKYTGADVNFSILASAATSGQQDPLTGDIMLPPNESRYNTNASIWYDDGKLNLRLAMQKRSASFNCITPCGGNNIDTNYPGEQWTNVRLVAPGYNPGVPRFSDETTFFDMKISYNINRNFQVYMEGRNMTRESQTFSTGDYVRFADGTPRVMRLIYGGRRLMGGVRLRFGG